MYCTHPHTIYNIYGRPIGTRKDNENYIKRNYEVIEGRDIKRKDQAPKGYMPYI